MKKVEALAFSAHILRSATHIDRPVEANKFILGFVRCSYMSKGVARGILRPTLSRHRSSKAASFLLQRLRTGSDKSHVSPYWKLRQPMFPALWGSEEAFAMCCGSVLFTPLKRNCSASLLVVLGGLPHLSNTP